MSAIRVVLFSCLFSAACSSGAPAPTTEGFPAPAYASLATDHTQLSVELRTAPAQPPTRGTSSAELRVHDASGKARDGLALTVTPWMPAHGHGTSVMPVVTPTGDGAYVVEQLAFTMPGTWELRIAMTGEGGFEDHATTTIEVR